jgi:hypothetical protein
MRNEKYQGVTGFIGPPGGGKTYALAEVGARALGRGERVISNEGFDLLGSEVLALFEDFAAVAVYCTANDHLQQEHPRVATCPDGHPWVPVTVLWDELPVFFNARKWGEFPDGMLYKFTQIRKDGIRLYYSSIDEGMIDTNIRRITFWYVHCRARTGRWLTRAKYPPHVFRKASAKPYARRSVWVRDSIAAMYDTLGKVQPPAKVRERLAAEGVLLPGTRAQLAAAELARVCRCPGATAPAPEDPTKEGPEGAFGLDPDLGRFRVDGDWAVGEGAAAGG